MISEHYNDSPKQGNIVPAEELSIEVPSTFVCPNPDASVFDDSSSSGGIDGTTSDVRKPRRNSSYILRTPPQLRPRSATSHNLPQPSKTFRDGIVTGCPGFILQRPLPDRPLPELPVTSPNDTWLGPSRKSSNASATPSVAPSLISYVKNESYLNETVEYGQAQEVRMEKDRPGVPVLQDKTLHSSGSTPVSDCDITHSATNSPYQDEGNVPPSRDQRPSLESMPPRNINGEARAVSFGSAMACEQNESPTKENVTTRSRDLAFDFAKFPHLKLSESDWKPRTPSPQLAPRRILSPGLGRLWSTLRRNKSRSPLRNVHKELATRNHSTPQLTGSEVKERHGNWI